MVERRYAGLLVGLLAALWTAVVLLALAISLGCGRKTEAPEAEPPARAEATSPPPPAPSRGIDEETPPPVSLGTRVDGGAEPPEGRAAWGPPPERPALREILDDDRYSRDLEAALAKIDKAALEASTLPVMGMKIWWTRKGAQADRLGIRPGDYLIEMGGRPVLYDWQFGRMRSERAQEFLIHHPDGRRETVEVDRSHLGIKLTPHWAPELEFLRGKKRSPEWDGAMLVALTRFESDPILAETALAKAVAAGYEPDSLTDMIAAEIAACRGRSREAMAFARLAAEADPRRVPAANTLFEVAAAHFKIDVALRTLRRYPDIFGKDWRNTEKLYAEYRRRWHGQRAPPLPSELAKGRGQKDLLGRAQALNRGTDFFVKHLLFGGAALHPPAKSMIPLVFGPAIAEGEMVVRFRAKGYVDKSLEGYFTVGWTNQDRHTFEKTRTCPHIHGGFGVAIHGDKEVSIIHEVGQITHSRIYHDVHVDGKTENTLRLTVCGGLCEAVLNGRLIFHAPMPSKVTRLVTCIKAAGMKVNISQITVDEITGEPAEEQLEEGEEVF